MSWFKDHVEKLGPEFGVLPINSLSTGVAGNVDDNHNDDTDFEEFTLGDIRNDSSTISRDDSWE